jgi:hypothetical protein
MAKRPSSAGRINYSQTAIEEDIKTAMCHIKQGLQPSQIGREDTLKKWQFTRVDGRGLAPTLVTLYAHRQIRLDPRIFNYETEDVNLKVRQLAAHIKANHAFHHL